MKMFVGLEEGANLDLVAPSVGSLYIGVCFRTVMLRGGNWQSHHLYYCTLFYILCHCAVLTAITQQLHSKVECCPPDLGVTFFFVLVLWGCQISRPDKAMPKQL